MKLAINGGKPIRNTQLQYGYQTIDETDKQAVLNILDENKFLTTGPKVTEFEDKIKEYCGSKYACAVNSGTAALHLAIEALEMPNDTQVIVSIIKRVIRMNRKVSPIVC